MFTRCLSCHREFPPNETLEHAPLGRRVAYDPERGRLWTICSACRSWTLAPFEERWEALEELERAVRDRAVLLSETDHVSLLRDGRLEIVRVGRAGLQEQAWWRYGREFLRRRKTYRILTVAGVAGVGALLLSGWAAGVGVGGSAYFLVKAGKRFPDLTRRFRFGRTAWRGEATCATCGRRMERIPFKERRALRVVRGEGGEPAVDYRCPGCDSWADGSGFRLAGAQGSHALRRALAYENYAGGTEQLVRDASRQLLEAGSAERWTERVAEGRTRIGKLDPAGRLALEIAANEETERRWLQLELAALERRWREEEELASIVDGELTPFPGLRRLLGGDAR